MVGVQLVDSVGGNVKDKVEPRNCRKGARKVVQPGVQVPHYKNVKCC